MSNSEYESLPREPRVERPGEPTGVYGETYIERTPEGNRITQRKSGAVEYNLSEREEEKAYSRLKVAEQEQVEAEIKRRIDTEWRSHFPDQLQRDIAEAREQIARRILKKREEE